MQIITIGVYGSTEESFFNSLADARVDTFCDLRQRRGVRGSKYAYVNKRYLQKRLDDLKINYVHIRKLAPSLRVRKLQKEHDLKSQVKKKNRKRLGNFYVEEYKKECLSNFSYDTFLQYLPENSEVVCLFCVEKEPDACHRSLVANFLAETAHLKIKHIMP